MLLGSSEGAEHAYLSDFGLARPLAERGQTQAGELAGSPDYLAPELIEGASADERSDLYALGCLLYACLTGAPPFRRSHEAATLWAHLREPAPSGSPFEEVVLRALAKDPQERFSSAGELAAALAEASAAPGRALGTSGNVDLPQPATPFLGRERELAEVGALLAREDVRMLTLTGPGGTGKTRLALQAAAEAAGRFPDGVHWVPLAPLRDPRLVLAAVARVLEVQEEPQRPLAQTLAEALDGKRVLLVLDNVEHLLPEAAAEIAALEPASGTALLTTSRERLQLPGEQLYAVPTLAEDEALDLFLARARSLDAGFQESSVLAELCARLDHLPLALELAAARTTIFAPEQLLERLAQRLDLLKGGRGADPRQQTLRTTIEWSHDLLEPQEQRLFRSLSVFAGGCRFEAAEEVALADPDILQSLLDKSLLRRRSTELGPRFWMLETIREYAVERLEEAGETEEVRRRHAAWMLAVAQRADEGFRGPDARTIVLELAQEYDNLQAALAWMEELGELGLSLELIGASSRFWEVGGHWLEGRRWAESVLARSGDERTVRRAVALRVASGLAMVVGDFGSAKARGEEALEIFRELGETARIANLLTNLGSIAAELGDYAEAERLYGEAADAAREMDARSTLAFVTGNLGNLALVQGEYERAAARTEEALALFRDLGVEGNARGRSTTSTSRFATFTSGVATRPSRRRGRAWRCRMPSETFESSSAHSPS